MIEIYVQSPIEIRAMLYIVEVAQTPSYLSTSIVFCS